MVPRACEGCKIRKIRCDRSIPFSNCPTSGIACQKNNPSIRPESRAKPDSGAQIQEHIQQLEERLGAVERELTALKTKEDRQGNPVAERVGVRDHHGACQTTDVGGLYEGGSSFTHQSMRASEVAQRAAGLDGTGEPLGLDASLSDLNTLLRSPAISPSPADYRFSQSSAPWPKMVHLPLDLILVIVQEIKQNRPIFLCSYAITDPSLVESFCRKVYFPTKAVSPGDLACIYGILLPLLKEFMILQNQLCQKYDLKAHALRCEENFNAVIETYDVLAVPTFENIFAPIMGYTKAQDEGKSLLCCTVISAAASHCQLLGYNHETIYEKDRSGNSENMRRLFWTTYVFEKHTSLLFGRASRIQDLDIDARYPAVSINPAFRPWDESFIMAIKLAKLQGQIFDNLYSSAALKISSSKRVEHINELATAMQQWHTELQQIESNQVNNDQVFKLSRDSWEIMYYSTFTSLLRAPTASGIEGVEISSLCFTVARQSLQGHLRCFGNYRKSGFLTDAEYANWVLLFSSFTPFVVIFLHAIAATSLEELRLLEDVVESLHNIRKVSQGSENLYEICSIFSKIARGLVETKRSCVGTYNQHEDSLQFVNGAGYPFMSNSESLQSYLEVDMASNAGYPEAHDMSAILDSWATGPPFGMNLFGVRF